MHVLTFVASLMLPILTTNLVADSADTTTRIELDCRTTSEAEFYRILFTSRRSDNAGLQGKPGHAYVLIGEYNEKEHRCKTEGLYGLYPISVSAAASSWFFGPVDGFVGHQSDDNRADLITAQVDVLVNKKVYDAVKSQIDSFAKAKQYELGTTDCVTLLERVFNITRDLSATNCLVTPTRLPDEAPSDYLTRAVKANSAKPD